MSSDSIGKHVQISHNAYVGTCATFFGLAIIATIARTAIRIHTWRRLYIDDFFLFIAVVSLIISTTILFHELPAIYFAYTASSLEFLKDATAFFQEAKPLTIETYVAISFSWITVSSVKFSFLFYFRTLVRKIRPLVVLWWVNLVVLVPIACVLIVAPAIVCPYPAGEVVAHCTGGSSLNHREQVMIYVFWVAGDILTDLLLISIPVLLLKKTKLRTRQKISVGVTLCLSAAMIGISLIRGISARFISTEDTTWDTYFLQLEANISVIMVSITAFRTLFTAGSKRSRDKLSPAAAPPPTWRMKLLRREATKHFSYLPDIEAGGATMTGMRTMIRENGRAIPGGSFAMTDITQKSLATTFESSECF